MRLFKSSNKSQASLDRLTGSRDHSPTQQSDSTYSQAQAYGGPPPSAGYPPSQYSQQQQQQQQQQLQYQQALQQPENYYTEGQAPQHPAHYLSRTQSNRAASGAGDPYAQDQQPTVTIVPPSNPSAPQNPYNSGQTSFGQPQSGRPEKEQKKSKRGIFGVLSKREDKEEGADRRSVGRVPSILKKGGPQSPQTQQHSPRAPSSQYSDSRQPGLDERFSSESLSQESRHYNQYHESQEQYRQQDQFDSPQSQHTRQSVQYIEDSRYQTHQQGHSAQDRQFPLYQLRESANNSETNLPYQGGRGSIPNQDPNHALRPPSQTSFGPPSPLVGHPHHDSRPSTSNTQPQRYSSQSQQQQSQQQTPQIQQPQPQQHQLNQLQAQSQSQPQHDHSLPPSQQPTPQPTPQPQGGQLQDQSQPPAISSSPTMPRNESNGRRHDDHVYSQQDPRMRAQDQERGSQGRSTPPLNRGKEDLSSLDYGQLLAKHEELQAKYSKVKRYYFEREAQVTQLQNTVANQRLSMSKTSLDDAGYTTRFERLNGAIQNLSFNIRKDWRRVPNWLAPVCNRDAHTVGTKEMTAVGRACITRWLHEAIFDRVFHPGIDPNLSAQLKQIEKALRRTHFSSLTSEQQDDLLTKITTWRLTTIEGLQDVLNSRQSEIYTDSLIMNLAKQLEAYLRTFLVDPPPPGLTDGLTAIVGQTVGIAQNIPLESRDVCIEYFMPGTTITEIYMRLEPGMTVLAQPGSAPSASDHVTAGNDSEEQLSGSSSQIDASSMNVEDAIRESAKAASAPGQGSNSQRNESISQGGAGSTKPPQMNSNSSAKEKKGFLGGFVNKKPTPAPSSRTDVDPIKAADNSHPDHAYTLQSLTNGTMENKIRFAAFLAVEVRGRGVLKEAGKDGEKSSGSSKDSDDKKDNSTGGGVPVSGSANMGVQKGGGSSMGTNILCKAPVYAFE